MKFYCIAGEPSSFMTMANMAHLLKKLSPEYTVEAIIPRHDFLMKMSVEEFLNEFDRVWYLPLCDFQRNVFKGLRRGRAFKRGLKNIVFDKNSIVFAFISMEMSLNLAIKFVSDNHKTIKIVFLSYTDNQIEITSFGGRLSILMTALNLFYALILRCAPMKSYVASNGQLMYREYFKQPAFTRMVLLPNQENPAREPKMYQEGDVVLPYPAVIRDSALNNIKMDKFVVFFGDANMTDFYTQLDRDFLFSRTFEYIRAIHDYYRRKDITVYYKPHPFDGDKIMPGCESVKLPIFSEKINAEMLFSKYHSSIVAVYTVSSHSVLFGAKNGIPGYWAHEICFSDERLKCSFRKFNLDNTANLFKSLTCFGEIGTIDGNKINVDMAKLMENWKKGISVLLKNT